MLDLVPGKVADVDESLNAILRLGEHTEVGDVAYDSLVDRAYRVLVADALPRVRGELLQTEGHLPVLTVDGENLCLYLVTYLEELLRAVESGDQDISDTSDKTLNTRLNLRKRRSRR